uniref:Uncharacterized protein n=1 Tax=Panagrolaimus superbus TaxID=310955 RepID=A0A914Z467_9BILA
MTKHITTLRDDIMGMLLSTLENCEIHGKDIPTMAEGPLVSGQVTDVRKTVAYEARLLRALILKIMGY